MIANGADDEMVTGIERMRAVMVDDDGLAVQVFA
jgi:hypothetical protein